MPCIKIQTNVELNNEERRDTLSRICSRTSAELGKPESVTMVILEPKVDIFFKGSPDPAAFIELKSIGLTDDSTDGLSAFLCSMITEYLNVPGERIYIEFSGARGAMWGWNGKTFRKF